jgi:pyruvate/2-oxoglutarate dehydrogenase complex dihydrolipoamide acyltransferase (E2) component
LLEVSMPKLHDQMEKGTIRKWLKNEGDQVSEGDEIAYIHGSYPGVPITTYKLKAENTGTLTELIADEDQEVPVGEPIARIKERTRTKGTRVKRYAGSGQTRAKSGGHKEGFRDTEDPLDMAYQEVLERTEEIRPDMSEEAREKFARSIMAPLLQQRDAQEDSATATRRLNVVFSEAAYDDLRELANQSGKTISGVVRDAIALQKWFNGVRREGGRILVEQRGRVREIMNIR